MSGILLKYGGIAIDSDKAFNVESENQSEFATENQILNRNLNFRNIGNPCELYSVVLDGSASAFPEKPETENIGFWSKTVSDENGYFANPIELEFVSSELFSSAGITIVFDKDKNIFASDIIIQWFNDDDLISEKSFTIETASAFCANKVEFFNRVIIKFNRMTLPYNRLKIQRIEFGMVANFTGVNLKSANTSQNINPIAAELPINTFNFTLVSKGIDYAFQERQPIEVYFNDELQNLVFIKNTKRKSETDYDIYCEDYIGILDNTEFMGNIYVNKDASELIQEVFDVAQVPCVISDEIKKQKVTGYLKRSSCREALKQVLFAIQAIADTTKSKVVKIYKTQNELRQEIPKTRILQGLSIDEETRTTAVEIVAHSYTPIDTEQVLFEASKNGTGKHDVFFSEPMHGLTISNGTILESGNNYAKIQINTNGVLKGKKFSHVTTNKIKENPIVLSTDTKNVRTISDATLVNAKNVDILLHKCYNYLTSTQIANAKIVEGKKETDTGFVYDKSVNIGDVIKIDTGYQGKITGFVESQKYSLNGGILVKDSSIHLEGQSGGLNSEPQLPSKYKKLQYIEATGEQYIDADYLFLSDQKPYRIKVDFELTQMPHTMNIFGVALNTDNRYPLTVLVNSQKKFCLAHYGSSGSAVAFADGDYNRHIVEYVFDEGVYFDGIIQQNTVEQAKNSYNAYIEQADWTNPSFGIFTTIRGDAEYTARRAFAKIYSFEFWNDIGLERKYIPAQRKSDGTIGLFELYTQTFFTNQGDGKFIGG